MGTRGFYGFRYKGRYILFYNHWDSYCGGIGQQIRDELANFTEADYKTLVGLLKQHLLNKTLKEGDHWGDHWDEGERDYESLMKVAQNPKKYVLSHVSRECPGIDLYIEYTYIVDLDKKFLRVITGNDKFKFPLHELPPRMDVYDEECEDEVDTDLSDEECA